MSLYYWVKYYSIIRYEYIHLILHEHVIISPILEVRVRMKVGQNQKATKYVSLFKLKTTMQQTPRGYKHEHVYHAIRQITYIILHLFVIALLGYFHKNKNFRRRNGSIILDLLLMN